MKFNIVYSITAHESPECVIDLIENINHFGKSGEILLLLHLNTFLYNIISKSNYNKPSNVIINPIYWDKRKFTSDILKAHIENYEYITKVKIECNDFIMIASNCLFHKPLLEEREPSDIKKYKNPTDGDPWWWETFFSNKRLISFLAERKFVSFIGFQHEGTVHTKETMDILLKFKNENIFDLIDSEIPFEEIIPVTVYLEIHKKYIPSICKVFWGPGELTVPTPEVLEHTNLSCIKWVPREYFHPLRVWIRKKIIS